MNTARLLLLAVAASFAAHADFSYTQTMKSSQGAPQVTKVSFKGARMMSDRGDTAVLLDFTAQTITTLNKTAKTYSVQKMGDLMAGAPSGSAAPQVDFKETGQKKTVNGLNCGQSIMTMAMDGPGGAKMQIEIEMWVSSEVPGWQNLRAFYQKNDNALSAMGAGNPGMQHAMAEMQKKMASMNGMPVEQIIRMKMPSAAAQMPQMQAGMDQARAKLEEMIKQGGPQADAARQALARMPGGSGGAAGGRPLFETTTDSSNFSAAELADAVFAIPAGFTQK
ncbi:MAG TPA: DUF4412 domain-containing protein [Candidatus Sulfopaludibacter sp.]|nr:DUF4412 domain-containing protein [Candidatus Sulfopaludibacter sp.]